MYKGYNLPGGAGVIFFGYKHGILATIPIGSDCSSCYWELMGGTSISTPV